MKKTVVSVLSVFLFFSSCMEHRHGEEPAGEKPVKVVLIHTSDSHSKYLPFRVKPNMFDREMGLRSDYPPCWNLNDGQSGGPFYCDGAWSEKHQGYRVWDGSEYIYVSRDKLIKPSEQGMKEGYITEDFNHDGICDIKDCQRCWDRNRNNFCDPEEDVNGDGICDINDCLAQKDDPEIYKCWDREGPQEQPKNGVCDWWEDKNNDEKCGLEDCVYMWDKNNNFKCDFPYDNEKKGHFYSEGHEKAGERVTEKHLIEDINKDGVCDSKDYFPELVNTGGVARVATVAEKIRQKNKNIPVLHFDSGDTFQGAPQFNLFQGEMEMLTLSSIGVDAMVIGNHEFDNGVSRLEDVYREKGGPPLLAANYLFESSSGNKLHNLVKPYIIMNRGGLKIGVVGIGNDSSLTSLSEVGNSLGFVAKDPVETAKHYVSMIRSRCDIVILLTHTGLEGDYELAENVSGVDIILGGHHHVVLDPVKVLKGPDGKDTLIIHSGVDFKIVGELELIVRNREISWYDYRTHPITDSVPEDPEILSMLDPYIRHLDQAQNLKEVVGETRSMLERNDVNGGDSMLGNLLCDSMMDHTLVKAEFATTNTLGIRADIPAGSITREKLYEVFPFENTVVYMYMSGKELKEMFDFNARRSASRGCTSQLQIGGAQMVVDCSPPDDMQEKYGSYALTKYLKIGEVEVIKNYKLLQPYSIFKMATNDYMGGGGSGFSMLKRNTTAVETSVPLRDAFISYLEKIGVVDPDNFSADKPENKRIRMLN